MRVEVHPADAGGCGYYRLRWAAEALQNEGADVVIGTGLRGVYQDDEHGQPITVGAYADADVVVLQRVLNREVCDLIPHLQAAGTAVVVEIDDHFHGLPRSNPAYEQTDPTRSATYNRDVLARACELADLVTCTTPGLAKQYGRHGRVQVIPNYARSSWLDLPAPDPGPLTIGWTGATMTHRGDLDDARDAIREVLAGWPAWTFHALGSDRVQLVLGIARERFSSAPWADLLTDDYPRAIQQIGLGIVPLRDSSFNRVGKSWLKGLEYAACGVPFVASRVGDYERLARHLTFPLVRGRGEWVRALGQLLDDEDRRLELAGVNRDRVRRSLTIEGNLQRWTDAWRQAWTHRRR